MKAFYMSKTAPIVNLPGGRLRGYHFDGVDHFLGIRYATAKRFHMPKPVKPWKGLVDATSYGWVCPLLEQASPEGELMTPHRYWPQSEHCQYLNVWTGKSDPDARLPVMFWVHGGGFSTGSAIEQECYDGFNLARHEGVVVVSVNHRLNAFGYMDLSDFGPAYANSVNVGMADLVEALRWVRDNIACFGGDPDNITIFGQSGGGGKVTILGQIEEAEGLFHRMIVMSGVIPPNDFKSDCAPRDFVLEVLGQLGLEPRDIIKLETIPEGHYIRAVNRAIHKMDKKGYRIGWAPIPNGYYSCDPLQGEFSDFSLSLPTLVGTVIAEFGQIQDYGERDQLSKRQRESLVKKYYGQEGGKDILSAFREAYPHLNEIYAMDLDTLFLPGSEAYVKKKAQKATAPVFQYIFTKVFDYDGGRAAWHCADIPFFFRNAGKIPICHQKNWQFLEKVMVGAFVNFARTGNPNTEGLPAWEPCSQQDNITMVLDDRPYSRANLQQKLLPLVLQHKPPFRFNFKRRDPEEE